MPVDDENTSENTEKLTRHIPSGYGYIVVSPYDFMNSDQVTLYRGENAGEYFINSLENLYKKHEYKLTHVKPMHLTEEDAVNFNNASSCYVCNSQFECQKDKAKDHDHINGKYRGAAHRNCNLQMQQEKKIIIFMHNAKG